jgi:hypothetical protein
MKKLLLSVIIACASIVMQGQSLPEEVKIKFIDKDKKAASFELPYPTEIVEKAIQDRMAAKGSRPEKMRGFTLYRGVDVKHLGERADLYFKVERKSRKDKNASVITVFAVSPNENAATTTTDTDKLDDSKEVLLSLVPEIESKDVETNIANQEAQIRDAEKKLKRMQDDQAEYEAKIKTLQDKLEENRKNQDLQTLEIEKMKSFRDAMKDKQSQLGKTGS